MTEIACGSKEFAPFPVSPKGKPGWVPPTPGGTLRAKKERLARIDAAGSPPRGLPPPWGSPCKCAGAEVGPVRNNRMFTEAKRPKIVPTLEDRLHQNSKLRLLQKKKSRHGVLT